MTFELTKKELKTLGPDARKILYEQEYWDKHIQSYQLVTKIMEKAGFYDWIEDLCEFKPTDSIIDVGCGTGNFLAKVIPKIHFGIGFDISGKACALCRQTFRGTKGMVPHDIEDWKTPEKLPQHSASTCESILAMAQEELPRVDNITMLCVFNSENYRMSLDYTKTLVLNISPATEILKDKGRLIIVHAVEDDEYEIETQKGLFNLLIQELNQRSGKEKGYTLSVKFEKRTEKDSVLNRLQRVNMKKLKKAYLNRTELTHLAIIIDKKEEK